MAYVFETDTGKKKTVAAASKYALFIVHFQSRTYKYFPSSGTVADNIRYGPQLRGKKLSDDEVHKLLSLADLDASFFSKMGSELSVGQAQRVALARTLANAPEVLTLLAFTEPHYSMFSLGFRVIY